MLITNEIVLVKNIFKCKDGSIFLNVFTFKSLNFFDTPLESHMIGSMVVDMNSQSSNLIRISVNDIKYKCFFVPLSTEKAIVMALSHNEIV